MMLRHLVSLDCVRAAKSSVKGKEYVLEAKHNAEEMPRCSLSVAFLGVPPPAMHPLLNTKRDSLVPEWGVLVSLGLPDVPRWGIEKSICRCLVRVGRVSFVGCAGVFLYR